MIKNKNIEAIANAVANASDTKLTGQFADLLADLKEEIANEEFTLEHGIQHASERDIEDEFVSLDAVEAEEEEDFDSDENLTDMNCISGAMRDIFES